MKKLKLSFILLFIGFISFSQSKVTNQILNEGKLLYRLEKGSWYGTDHILENYKGLRDSIGGYLSYENENSKIITIFTSRTKPERVLVRYTFDSLPVEKPILIDIENHKISATEKELLKIKEDARQKVNINENNFFKFYENSSYNFIPIITEKEKKVFILTGPNVEGVLLLGNDYLLTYSKKGNFKKKEKIHNSLIKLDLKSKTQRKTILSTIHSHVKSKYINSTDICTLLLYKNYSTWNQHIVVNKKYVSVFDMKKETLLIMPYKTWKKISN